ncbi:hypothetical protein ACFRKE_04985 [Kitasatospora indigofera]|uniref:hypothetical protein n=1 Tax=Kitasatospora indigofera TaxID=67307 RepID=UPI003660E98E
MNPTGPAPAATATPTRTGPWLPGALAVLWGLPGLGLLGYSVHTLAQFLGGTDGNGEFGAEGQVSLILVTLFTAAVAVPALVLATLCTVACVRLRRGRPGSEAMVFAVGLASVVGAVGAAGWTNWWPYHGWIQALLVAAGLLGAIAAATARPSRRTPATR